MFCPDCFAECEQFDDYDECPVCGEQFDVDSDEDDPEPYDPLEELDEA